MNFTIRRTGPNRIVVDEEVARIEVIRRSGQIVYFTIDKADVELVSRLPRWFYCMGYCYACVGDRQMNLTWLLAGRPDKGYVLHHVNGDKTDNRRENIQKITWTQHHCLEKTKPNNTTGIRGISRYRDGAYCVVVGRIMNARSCGTC